mmetsp:Transcript_9765/g.25615  ORF Transcript_9765/g.25615 Transcript_9765/m.25615 type:complete len:537 (-) Transcript_9765:97-1707(-)
MLMHSMDDLKAPGPTWASEVQKYEREKRRAIDEGFLNNRQVRVTGAQTQLQARVFDPLQQRFRDNATELQQRTLEEKERVNHLNRAMDISILRSQPVDIINHASKLEALAPGMDPMRLGPKKPRNRDAGRPGGSMPDSGIDYNLISNLPHQHHHWARPEARPHAAERMPKERTVPPWMVKDFDIVTNRYRDDHDHKIKNENDLKLLEAAKKYAAASRFDPVAQQFNDPRAEENFRAADDAREMELVMRAESQLPPSTKGRESNFYDVVSHKVHDADVLRLYDQREAERKTRLNNRYIVEHNLHKQDIKGEQITNARTLQRIAPERFQEDGMRGYDILNNKRYGALPHEKLLYEASTRPRPSPWEKAQVGKEQFAEGPHEELRYIEPLGGSRGTLAASSVGRNQLVASASAPTLTASGRQATRRQGVHESTGSSASRASAALAKEPTPAAMPPGRTAPPARLAPPSEAGSRALSVSSSAKHLRGSTASEGSFGGDRTNLRRPLPEPGASRTPPVGGAPPAPMVPGSPGTASVYSRRC